MLHAVNSFRKLGVLTSARGYQAFAYVRARMSHSRNRLTPCLQTRFREPGFKVCVKIYQIHLFLQDLYFYLTKRLSQSIKSRFRAPLILTLTLLLKKPLGLSSLATFVQSMSYMFRGKLYVS